MPDSNKHKNRRRSVRVALMREIEYAGSGVRTHRRLTELGANGVYIDTVAPLPEGTPLDLRFTLPDDHIVMAQGVVRYCQPGAGMGVEFTSISDDDHERIQHWIGRLA